MADDKLDKFLQETFAKRERNKQSGYPDFRKDAIFSATLHRITTEMANDGSPSSSYPPQSSPETLNDFIDGDDEESESFNSLPMTEVSSQHQLLSQTGLQVVTRGDSSLLSLSTIHLHQPSTSAFLDEDGHNNDDELKSPSSSCLPMKEDSSQHQPLPQISLSDLNELSLNSESSRYESSRYESSPLSKWFGDSPMNVTQTSVHSSETSSISLSSVSPSSMLCDVSTSCSSSTSPRISCGSPKRRCMEDDYSSYPSTSNHSTGYSPEIPGSPVKRRRTHDLEFGTLSSSSDSTHNCKSEQDHSKSNEHDHTEMSLIAKSATVLMPVKSMVNSISEMNLGNSMSWEVQEDKPWSSTAQSDLNDSTNNHYVNFKKIKS